MSRRETAHQNIVEFLRMPVAALTDWALLMSMGGFDLLD